MTSDATEAAGRWCDDCDTASPTWFCPLCGNVTGRRGTSGNAGDEPDTPEPEPDGEDADPADDTATGKGNKPRHGNPSAGDGWWNRRKATYAGVIAAVIVIVVAGFFWRQTTGDRDAEGPVVDYFAALADGDAAAARDLLGAAKVPDSPLWADGALKSGYRAPAAVAVTDVDYGAAAEIDQRPNMSYATVHVTYNVDGDRVEQRVGMARETEGLERSWSITFIDVGRLNLSAGTSVAAAGELDAGVVAAPPGLYTVESRGNALFAPGQGEVAVTPVSDEGQAEAVRLDQPVRPEAVETVTRLIRDRIDDCVAAAELDWDTCPWQLGDSGDRLQTQTADWTVTRYPDIDLDDDGDVTVTTPGSAEAEYTIADGTTRTATADLVPTGVVTVDTSGELTWTYSPEP